MKSKWMNKAVFFILYWCLINPLYAEENMMMTERPCVVIETNKGNFEVVLYPNIAPKACENFITHINNGYYVGTIFHRVIKGFMIQGGDPQGTGTGGKSIWEKPFNDECVSDIKFDKQGLLAMANAGPNTNGSQFFITTAKTPWLNMRHTIFGEVKTGYDVVEKLENSPVGLGDRPKEPLKIIKTYLKNPSK